MHRFVRIAVMAVMFGAPSLEALAQGMGPLNTLPFGARSRTKPNPEQQQTLDQDNAAPKAPLVKPVEAAPEPAKPKTADK